MSPTIPTPNLRRRKTIKQKAIFYHAGCSVCIDVEQRLAGALDPAAFDVEIVHLGTERSRLGEAEAAGVKSVPALVIDDQPYHINFGADLSALK